MKTKSAQSDGLEKKTPILNWIKEVELDEDQIGVKPKKKNIVDWKQN